MFLYLVKETIQIFFVDCTVSLISYTSEKTLPLIELINYDSFLSVKILLVSSKMRKKKIGLYLLIIFFIFQ